MVNVTKRVKVTGKGWRLCKVVWSGNNRIKPDWVVVDGKEEEHPEGRYYLDWIENGQRKRVAGGRFAAEAHSRAEHQGKLLAARKAAKAAGTTLVENVSVGRSVKGAVEEYLAEVKLNKKPKTYAAYKIALDYFLESCHKPTLETIERSDLLRFRAYLRDKRKQTARSEWNKFSNVMSFLKAQGVRDLGIKKGDWPQYVEEKPEIYEREELDKFFAACTPEERLYFDFLLMTGFREQEMMYATWRNVNFVKNIIKMGHNPDYSWTPKAYREREVPVPQKLINALKDWKNKQNLEVR